MNVSVALMSRLLNISARKHVVISLHAPKKLLKRNFGVTKREKEKKKSNYDTRNTGMSAKHNHYNYCSQGCAAVTV